MRRRHVPPLILIAVLFLSTAFSAEPPVEQSIPPTEPLTLDECIRLGLERHSDVLVAQDEIAAAEEQRKMARSEFLFKVNTRYAYTRLDSTPVLESFSLPDSPRKLPVGTVDNWNWTTEFTQPLFTGFKILAGYDLAKLGIDLAQVSLAVEKLNLVYRVKQAYFNLLRAEKGEIVAETAVRGFEAQAKVAKDFYDVGMTPKNDYLKALVEAANARQGMIQAGNLTRIRQAELNNLLRFPVDRETRVVDTLKYEPVDYTLEYCMEQAYGHRPEIEQALLNTKASQENVRLVRSGFFPNVALSFNYHKFGDTWKVDGSDFAGKEDWSVTTGLDWTFWEWGKTYYAASQARVRVKQSLELEEKLKEAIALEIKTSYLNLRESEQNISVTEASIEQAIENLRMSSERYKEQVTTSTEVLDAQTLLSQAQDNYYNALYRYNIALAQLRTAMGMAH